MFKENLIKMINKEKEILNNPKSTDKDKKDSMYIINCLTNKYEKNWIN